MSQANAGIRTRVTEYLESKQRNRGIKYVVRGLFIMSSDNNAVMSLPFITRSGDDILMWSPDESGVWALDNKIGRGYADDAVKYMRERGNPSLLGQIVKSMVARGKYGAVEVGFAHRMASIASQ